jgi:hypothetical protein
MYLIQKATVIVNNWTLNEDDALEVLRSFISSEHSSLLDEYEYNPSPELEKNILNKLESFACDYLFANQLSYL